MFYDCKLHHQDLHSGHLHFIYDTDDKTCEFVVYREFRSIMGRLSRRGEIYNNILRDSRVEYFKYKTIYAGRVIPYCKWRTYDGVDCTVSVDYSEIYPQLILNLNDLRIPTGRAFNHDFYRTTSRFYRSNGNDFYILIAYEFYLMLIKRNADCFASLFKELLFISNGEDWVLTLDLPELKFL